MVKTIVALDKAGISPNLVKGLESQLGCRVETFRELAKIKTYLETNPANMAIVNPYGDHIGVVEPYVDFIKNDLKQKNMPILIFSRTGVDKIAKIAGLVLGRDYAAYLRKPISADEFVEGVRRLLG